MTEYLQRTCPGCGRGDRTAEVASGRRAETLSFGELRPFWSGLFKEKIFFTYDRCSDCGLLYAPQFFDEAQLSELYSEMAPNMDVVPAGAIEATQRGYFDAATKNLEVQGSYLEVGPDVGYIVRLAAAQGAFDHFWLFEPNRAVHAELEAAAQEYPSTILSEMTDLSAVPDESVSLAVMIHVLDHLLDPLRMLKQIREKLKPGGRIAIVTHNERSILRRLMGTRFPPFCLQHPELYNPRSITRLLESAGYRAVDVSRSKNYFPVAFMFRQALYTAGIKVDVPVFPNTVLGLRLGNIMTTAER